MPSVRLIELDFDAELRNVAFGIKSMRIGDERRAPGVWWPTHTPDGLATLHLAYNGAKHRIRAEAWGSGAEWMLHQAADLLGVRDNPEEFEPPEQLRDAVRRQGALRFGRTHRVFEAMLPNILGQKVQTAMANRSLAGIVKTYGDTAPGAPGLRAFPSADRMASLSYADLHRFNLERKRADTIIRVARAADRLERIVDLDPLEADRHLQSIRGIGIWTSAWVRWLAIGDADAVPVGDFHIPNNVAWLLAGEARADDDRMLELLEPYAGHRGRVVRMIKSSGESAPKYGPRLSFSEFADK